MASLYSPWWKRHILYRIPGLYKKCPAGNYHLFTDRLCFCRCGEHGGDWHGGDWHGGIYDFKTGEEYQPCESCRKTKAYISSTFTCECGATESWITEDQVHKEKCPKCGRRYFCKKHRLEAIEIKPRTT